MIRRIRRLNRLKDYDYSRAGYYFVTICTQNKICWFGKVVNGEMMLNVVGKIVKDQWIWLLKQYSYIELDQFSIMPNHFHGILIICDVGNGRDRSLRDKIKSLPELIGAFKTTSSKLIHLNGYPLFVWQKSYYDHIIRNEKSLGKIRDYIQNNSLKWELDIENPTKKFAEKYKQDYYQDIFTN